MRRTRSEQRVKDARPTKRVKKDSNSDDRPHKFSGATSKKRSTSEQETKRRSPHKRAFQLKLTPCTIDITKLNVDVIGISPSVTSRRRSARGNRDSPVTKKCLKRNVGQGGRPQNAHGVNSGLDDSDSDTVVINKSQTSSGKRQLVVALRRLSTDRLTSPASTPNRNQHQAVSKRNGVPASVSEVETVEISSSSEDDDSSVDTEVTLRQQPTKPNNHATSTSVARSNTKIQQLEAELRQLKKAAREALCKKNEVIERVQNDLKCKDEQLEGMNELINKNMVLEAKIEAILDDKKAYTREVEKAKKRRTERETRKIAEDEESEPTSAVGRRTPSKRDQKKGDQKNTRRAKDKSGDLDEIDKLFLDGDLDGTEVDGIDEKTGEWVNFKAVEERAERQGAVDERPGKEVIAVQSDKGEESEDENSTHKGRRHIHKLLPGQKLLDETKAAAKAEKDRRERIKKEHQKHLVVTETDPKTKQPITTRLVLAFKKGTMIPLVEVNKRLIRSMKPHQVKAVEFLWDNLIESVDRLNSDDPGQGCILAHCMGLGKTLSMIGLVHTLLTSWAVGYKRCLVVCPLNAVLNWQQEWDKWLDKKDRLTVYELASARNNHERIVKLQKWQKSGGVLIMGYQIFRILSSYNGRSKKSKTVFDRMLIDPGPDIVVCDEGHMLKNDASAISKCMNRIQTKKRVILTGTPLQNNLVEYHCMVSFVKPSLLGTRREFSNRFVNPITNGQHSDSTAGDVRLMKRRAHVLHEMLEGCVQRRDYSALTKFLPPKHEYVIAVRLHPLQIELYRKYLDLHVQMEMDGSVTRGVSLFSDYQNLMRIWTHPWVLRLDEIRQAKRAVYESDADSDLLETSEEEEMEEEEEADSSSQDESNDEQSDSDGSSHDKKQSRTATARKGCKPRGRRKSTEDDNESESDIPAGKKAKIVAGEVIRSWKSKTRGEPFDDGFTELQHKEESWWASLVDEQLHKNCVELSGKVTLFLQIVKLAEQLSDKVLLFSQSLLTLDIIEDILADKTEEAEKNQQTKGSKKKEQGSMWVKEEDYLRMDGSTDAQQRRRFTTAFNDPKKTRLRLFLISTRAGGLGINLHRANRVIIFDASWNPSHDIQSIFRVFRFGQTKPVYVYRFLAQGTMEEKIYERQVTKETLSERVVDEHQIDRHFTAHDLQELYRFTPDQVDTADRTQRPTPIVPKDVILAELLSDSAEWIVQYHEHNSLLVNHPEEDLSEEERQAAWEEYEREKQGLYTYNEGYHNSLLPSQSHTSSFQNSTQQVHPRNFQISQLPRVVQEILKYNPNISEEDLEKRLQAFLGMNAARFSVPGHAMSTVANLRLKVQQSTPVPRPTPVQTYMNKNTTSNVTRPSVMTIAPITVTPQTSLVNRPPVTITLETSDENRPSRLPVPGNVPAMALHR